MAANDEDARFHILFKRMAGQIRARHEGRYVVGNGDLRVNPAVREGIRAICPSIQFCCWNGASHRRDRIDEQATALGHGSLNENPYLHPSKGRCVDRSYDRGDVIGNEAHDEEFFRGLLDDVQKYLFCTARRNEWCRRPGPDQFDGAVSLRAFPRIGRAHQHPGDEFP